MGLGIDDLGVILGIWGEGFGHDLKRDMWAVGIHKRNAPPMRVLGMRTIPCAVFLLIASLSRLAVDLRGVPAFPVCPLPLVWGLLVHRNAIE